MKKILLFLVCCLGLVVLANAQTRFAKPGAHWCIQRFYYSYSTFGEPIKSIDTVVQGIPCSAIPGVGCLFIQSDTVYRIINDSSIHFLYDYAAHAGDVWNIYLTPQEIQLTTNNNVKVHIDSTYVVNINGQNLRNIITSITDTPFVNYGYTLGVVTETIGNSFYFLPGPWGLVDFNVPSLTCFQDSVIGAVGQYWVNFPQLDSCVCHTYTGEETVLNHDPVFPLSPNPATNQLNISTGGIAITEINIYNTTGSLVSQTKQPLNNAIDISALPTGMYVAEIKTTPKSPKGDCNTAMRRWVKM